jgi:long-chain acyl-CoA synthetase
MSLAEILTSSAAQHPDNVAVKLDDVEVSYGMLDDATARVATLLRSKGVEVGDRVGVMLPNVPHFPIVFFGAQRAGAVVVPMNVLLKEREVGFYLEDSGAKVLFAWSGFAEAAEEGAAAAGAECVLVDPETFLAMLGKAEPVDDVVERAGDDTAVILYTSGTTGTPKGAELTHDGLTKNVEVSQELFSVTPDDVIFGGLPLFHVFGSPAGSTRRSPAGRR